MNIVGEAVGPIEKHWFTPENNACSVPLDPYNDRIIQFTALMQMGYPVEILKVPVADFPDDFFVHNETGWQRDNFPVWARPITYTSDFERYIEAPDSPGELIRSNDGVMNERLENHPMRHASHVDIADVSLLTDFIDRFEPERTPLAPRNGPEDTLELLTKEVLIGCFMAALERYVDWKARGYQGWWQDNGIAAVTVDHFIRHRAYGLQGYRPITPEQLTAVAIDYYRLAEQVQPDMLRFKTPPVS